MGAITAENSENAQSVSSTLLGLGLSGDRKYEGTPPGNFHIAEKLWRNC
jgi:hypothetical protein